MTGIFVFLATRSAWNRAAHRVRRLREPRYVVGFVIGLAYLYWFLFRQQLRAGRRPFDLLTEPELVPLVPAILVVAGLAIWFVAAVAWVWPSSDPPLKFTAAEVQFLYPAPVPRRQLLHYKILRSQVAVLFGVLVASLFSGALLAGDLGFVLGLFLLFSTLRLYLIGVGFTRASLSAGLGSAPPRAWVPAVAAGLVSLAIAGRLGLEVPGLLSLAPGAAFRAVVEAGREGILAASLWPFQALVVPLFSRTAAELLARGWPAVAIWAAAYWWALQSELTLETAAAASERQQAAGKRRAPAPTARPAPFSLGPRGRAEIAIAWKNLIQVGRYASPRTAVRVLLPLVVLSAAASSWGKGVGLAPLVAIVAGFLTVIGPYMVRNDLRVDMARLAVLKTWPLRGAELFLGEVLAPAVLLTVVVWGALAVALALSAGFEELTLVQRLSLAAGAALVAPAIILAQLVIQNAAVVLFPGWIPTGPARPRGIEAMGQQMLMFAGTLLVLALGVVPAGAVAAAIGFGLYLVAGFPALVVAAGLFSAALAAEAALAIVLLGGVLERTDPSAVEQEG